jgi:hypothetical protein
MPMTNVRSYDQRFRRIRAGTSLMQKLYYLLMSPLMPDPCCSSSRNNRLYFAKGQMNANHPW